jgi:hypothetical protein
LEIGKKNKNKKKKIFLEKKKEKKEKTCGDRKKNIYEESYILEFF